MSIKEQNRVPIYSYVDGKQVIMLNTDGVTEHVPFHDSMKAYEAGFTVPTINDTGLVSVHYILEKAAQFAAQKGVGSSTTIISNCDIGAVRKLIADDHRISNIVKVDSAPRTTNAMVINIVRQYAPQSAPRPPAKCDESDSQVNKMATEGMSDTVGEAIDYVDELLEERGKTHGDFGEQAVMLQKMRQCCKDGLASLPPEQRTAMEMIMLKQVRIMTGGNACVDSWDDIGGYAKLGAKYVPNKGSKKG